MKSIRSNESGMYVNASAMMGFVPMLIRNADKNLINKYTCILRKIRRKCKEIREIERLGTLEMLAKKMRHNEHSEIDNMKYNEINKKIKRS